MTLLLLLLLAFELISAQFDCSKLVCDPCRMFNPKVDFIFIVDASASMQDKIDGVKAGLQKFVDEIVKQSIDALYWVVLEGGGSFDKTELIVGGDAGTKDAAFLRTQFGRIRAAATVNGSHEYRGGLEPTFETIRMALGAARYNTFDHGNIGGTGRLKLRADAKKFIIIVTDEDSDAPLYSQNYAQFPFPNTDPTSWPSYTTGGYALELNATITAVIAADAALYMFSKPSCCQSKKQFGDPACDSSDANLQNFDRQKTLDCLNLRGYGQSLIGGLLKNGKLARNFDVANTANTGFINNFFQDAVTQAAKCELRKRHVDDALQTGNNSLPCVAYLCNPQIGCYLDFLCNPGCNQCKIGGKCYRSGDQNPAYLSNPTGGAGCQFCLPELSATSWSTCSGFVKLDSCRKYNCNAGFSYCGIDDVCTLGCKRCNIGGNCYKENWPNPDDNCLKCLPSSGFSTWTDTCPKCTPACENGGMCEGSPPTCNCTATPFVGATCADMPVCAKPCKNGGKCLKTGCSCEGIPYSGDDCSVCTDQAECMKLQSKTCPMTCMNGGICDPFMGKCFCMGTGFEGEACEIAQTTEMETTAMPTSMPLPFNKVCENTCRQQCAKDGFAMCMCDPNTFTITVQCNAPSDGSPTGAPTSPASPCADACTAACPNGATTCDCDASGKVKVECKEVFVESASETKRIGILVTLLSIVIATCNE